MTTSLIPRRIRRYDGQPVLGTSDVDAGTDGSERLPVHLARLDTATATNRQSAAAAAELAQHNSERIAAYETDVTTTWAAFSAADRISGYAYFGGSAAPADSALDPADEVLTYPGTLNVELWLRVPKGVAPAGRVRAVLRRGSTVRATHPAAGEVWESTNTVTSADTARFDYFILESETSGTPIAISGVSGDTLTLELATQCARAPGGRRAGLRCAARRGRLPDRPVRHRGRAALRGDRADRRRDRGDGPGLRIPRELSRVRRRHCWRGRVEQARMAPAQPLAQRRADPRPHRRAEVHGAPETRRST